MLDLLLDHMIVGCIVQIELFWYR